MILINACITAYLVLIFNLDIVLFKNSNADSVLDDTGLSTLVSGCDHTDAIVIALSSLKVTGFFGEWALWHYENTTLWLILCLLTKL